jgi:hypothetical protein
VKLIAPQLVKPYVKRGKNDTADAEAVCEAMSRPTMRFVPVKTAEQRRGPSSAADRAGDFADIEVYGVERWLGDAEPSCWLRAGSFHRSSPGYGHDA